MGFCRRCGEIVTGARCKCGGTAVAPVVPWNQLNTTETPTDRWSNTYVHSSPPTRTITTHTTGSTVAPTSSPTKRFPRPVSNYVASKPRLGDRVAAHIASTTSQSSRPPSPLKYSSILPAPESDILPSLSPHDTALSKVYGSVLQPKESLATHSCAICSAPFPPDATIYPDPNAIDSSHFLCKPCFTANGGSKGECPTCARPVLTLKSEGGFVHAAGRYWHKRCFNCAGCFKNIGDFPMLDLFGHPSCAECFDNCLNRDPSTPKKAPTSNYNSPRNEKATNLGGMRTESMGRQSREKREGSPAIEELEQRLGIAKSREGSPALEELSQRLSMIGKDSTSRQSISGNSPVINTFSTKYPTTSRDSSPLVDRSRERRDSRSTDALSSGRQYGRFRATDSITNEPQASPVRGGAPSPVPPQITGSPAPTLEAIEEMKQRFMKGSYSPSSSKVHSPVDSPSARQASMRRSRSSTSLREISSSRIPAPVFHDDPASPQSPAIPRTPDLMSDFSDTMTQSSFSGPDSPPRYDEGVGDIFSMSKVFGIGYGSRYTRGDFLDDSSGVIAEETSSELGTPTRTPKSVASPKSNAVHYSRPLPTPISPSPPTKPQLPKSSVLQPQAQNVSPSSISNLSASISCAGCGGYLFSMGEGGKFVTVPGHGEDTESMMYHIDCFRCAICRGVFKDADTGHAVFVRANKGPCHVECAPPTKITIRKVPSLGSLRYRPTGVSPSACVPISTSTPISTYISSSRIDRLPPTSVPQTTSLFPRFGSKTACPGCHKSVSPMERGVVPGPQGTRWHASCLVCGGKEVIKGWRGRDKKKGEPGCGKQLDSAAKSGRDGGVWCRECLLLLGVGGSPQVSPTRTSLVPAHTGLGKVMPQLTGTTIARQFTGLGGNKDAALLRQLTGGGLSPTRSISPTKQLGGGGRQRPKSVIGMRSSKSIDEGRGMFLVRQLTGASSGR